MPDWLLSIPAFIVAIGLLVAVHEYGHFWVARRMGVRVLRYSIGFGGKLFGYTSPRSGTEYWISNVPLGGYVKMLDEREGPVAPEDRPYAFNTQPVGRRIAIVAAGPAVNFLFALVAYWCVFMIGVSGIKGVLGDVPDGTPAAEAQLAAGDRIVVVDGEPTPTWQVLRMTLLDAALEGEAIAVAVETADGGRRNLTLDMAQVPHDPQALFDHLGLHPYQPKGTPVIAEALSGGAAAAAGLQSGDRVLAMGGASIESAQALVDRVRARPDETIRLTIERDGQTRDVEVALDRRAGDDGPIGRLGAQIAVDTDEWEALRTERRLGPLAAVPAAAGETWRMSSLTVRLLWQMVIGEVSWRNISGPIQIANYAGKTASVGLEAFLSFLALVSVSLGVLNLLPIPVLDGGHLLYYLAELVRGRPLSEEVQAAGQQLGMVALLLLMSLAFYNDILRLLG